MSGTGKRPDIVFILSDQHAQKIAGCYGDGLALTPNLDRLAARGVCFDNAYCPSPICTPSRMSLLTGRWPHEQSCWTLDDQLCSDLPTYAHALGAAGYRTVQIGKMHSIGPDQHHGFMERVLGEAAPNWLGVARQKLGVLTGAQGPAGPDPDSPSGTAISLVRSGSGQSGYEVVDEAVTKATLERIDALAADRAGGDDTPFCLGIGFVLPHCPFVAHREDYEKFEGRVGLPTIPRAAPESEHPWITRWRRYACIDTPSQDEVIRCRTAYYGLVHAMDRRIGLILDRLEASGLADNTLVIYASDHGEQLGERDLWWKNTFFEESAKVPLIVSWPGVLPEGERRASVANLIDIGATAIAAAGGPPLPRSHARSLLEIAQDPGAPWLDETFCEYVTDLSSPWTGPEMLCQRMLRRGRYKYVHMDGYRPQLFDLEADPQERNDLGADPGHAGVVAWFAERVLAGWDPAAIRREVAERCAEKAILRDWGKTTQPQSPRQIPLEDSDSWLDPR